MKVRINCFMEKWDVVCYNHRNNIVFHNYYKINFVLNFTVPAFILLCVSMNSNCIRPEPAIHTHCDVYFNFWPPNVECKFSPNLFTFSMLCHGYRVSLNHFSKIICLSCRLSFHYKVMEQSFKLLHVFQEYQTPFYVWLKIVN